MAKQDPNKTDPAPIAGLTPEAAAMMAGFQALVEELRDSRKEMPMAQAQAFEKVQNPSNRVPTGRSAFNQRGTKLDDWAMPELKCKIHAPWLIHPAYHGLDREEVELFNLLEPGEYQVQLVDDSTVKVRVHGIRNDITNVLEELRIVTNWTEEHKGKFPSMRLMLRQMLGDAANGVLTMGQEKKLIDAGQLSVSV